MSNTSWPDVIGALNSGVELDKSLATFAMREILSGNTEADQIKEFLIAHAEKGATASEVGAFIEVMYEHAAPLEITERAVDVVGALRMSKDASEIAALAAYFNGLK